MTAGLPIRCTVWDQNYQRRGPIGAPVGLEGSVEHHGVGEMTFRLPHTHPRVTDLAAEGARCVITYHPDDDTTVHLTSGPVDELTGGGPPSGPWRDFRVTDDLDVIGQIQCWPNPAGTISQQGDAGAYHVVTGPAETVLKDVLSPNVTRQGTNLVIPASSGAGATMTARMRFHTGWDLLPALDAAGLGVRVRQVEAARTLETFTPATYPVVLTQESGVVTDGTWRMQAPTVTRVVVAAGGEGTARVVREYIDTALEAEWGQVRPSFVDARDIAPDDPNLEALCLQRADERLAEGAPRASLSLSLTETEKFRFGKTFLAGDRVPVRMAGAPVLTDVVRSVGISWTPRRGVEITPRIGSWSDVADEPIVEHVAALTRTVTNLARS